MEMRSYLVSRLGDDQIRRARADARSEFERQYAQQKKELEESDRQTAQRLSRCNTDIAFKERNPMDCWVPLTWGTKVEPIVTPVETLYELNLMGPCSLVTTVRQAKHFGCLPK
jgi:hypothetical protein